MKKKGLALVLALALMVVGAVAGTLAWLTAESAPVVNTFTTSDIKVELKETQEPYKMIPGYTIHKDPKAKVLAGSEECFLFVKLEKSANFDSFMTYTVADGWTQLTGVTGVDNVYYRIVDADTATDQHFDVIKDNKVTVSGDVTKTMLKDLTEATQPTLTFTAYAVQLNKNNTTEFTAAEAWALAKTLPTT